MSSIILVVDKIEIVKSNIKEIDELVKSHIESLSYPMDSWLEDRLLESEIYNLMYESNCIGYAGLIKDTLQFFYVRKDCFRYAPVIFDKIVSEKTIKRVFIMTQDSLLAAIIAEWDYEKEKQACWFTDSGRFEDMDTKVSHAFFRAATEKDTQRIRQISGDFFDEVSGGFDCLEKRIAAEMIFLLEDNGELLGCGIVEKGQFCSGVASIGMYANRDYRRKGVAKTILMNLKEWAYQNNLRPVSGCWYYNTLSRKSLESVGMIATSIGYEAILKGKETLPLRTGNPPGELVRN